MWECITLCTPVYNSGKMRTGIRSLWKSPSMKEAVRVSWVRREEAVSREVHVSKAHTPEGSLYIAVVVRYCLHITLILGFHVLNKLTPVINDRLLDRDDIILFSSL